MGRFRSEKDRTEKLLLDYFQNRLDKKIEILKDQLELVKNTTNSSLSAKQLKQVKVKSSNDITDTVAEQVINKEERIKEIEDKIKVQKYFKNHTSKVLELILNDRERELLKVAYSNNYTLLKVALELGYSESHIKRKRKELVQQLDNNLFTLFNDYPVI